MLADLGTVEHDGANADQAAATNPATMQHRPVADGHLGADLERKTNIGVQYAAVLHVGTRTDDNWLGIAAQHRVEPDAGVLLDPHAPEHGSIVGHPIAPVRGHLDANAVELVECHG